MEINNQVAIVAGGGGGLGAETAIKLRAAGATVAILDINLESATHIAKKIAGLAVECDIASEHSLEFALDKVKHELGSARICVNCAAIRYARRVINAEGVMALSEFSKVININLVGTFNLMRLVAAQMAALDPINHFGERGVIINTASISAFEGIVGQVAYSAAKGGVAAMTLPAARELAQFGIRVNTIAPGAFATSALSNMPESQQEKLLQDIQFPKKFGDPCEYAKLVLHIIDNAMLNGSTIRLDAALRLR